MSSDPAGGAVTPLFTISLARLPENASRGGGRLRPLVARLAAGDNAVPLADQPNRLAALADRLQEPKAELNTTPSVSARGYLAKLPSNTNADGAARTKEGAETLASASASTGALWGQVEPCWRSLGISLKSPVVVEVSVNERGRLAQPPRVVRVPDAMLDEARLRSEAAALAGVGVCIGEERVRVPSGTYQVEFPKG